MENLNLHHTRDMRDIARDMKAGGVVVLDDANDAWLYTDGEVATRAKGIVGDVGHLRGAARIAAACKIVRKARGM